MCESKKTCENIIEYMLEQRGVVMCNSITIAYSFDDDL